MYVSLEGMWKVQLADGTTGEACLPGTLDENRIGHKDLGMNQWHPDAGLGNGGENFKEEAPIATRFTRRYTYQGEARFTRRVHLKMPEGKRVFLEAERARVLRLLVDGREIPALRPASISSPYVFELTGTDPGEHELTLLSDNSYPGLPGEAILYSSAATDETQTNWNGVLGYLRLRLEERTYIRSLQVYPRLAEGKGEGYLQVRAAVCGTEPFQGMLRLESEALREAVEIPVEIGQRAGSPAGAEGRKGMVQMPEHHAWRADSQKEGPATSVVWLESGKLSLASDVRLWDEEQGNLYEMHAILCDRSSQDPAQNVVVGRKTVSFGIRTFGDNGSGRLALNGRILFLRGEANCCEFPETGHAPMEEVAWEEILKRYRSYGVNCMRFHSHCPPEAAFAAADRLGMLMQPELSHWNPRDAFESEESVRYYGEELEGILGMLANHPSFVMLTFGNELHTSEKGEGRMQELLEIARTLDSTRLYAIGSNVFYGNRGCDPASDFYTSTQCHEAQLRGTSAGMTGYPNREYPDGKHNFDAGMEMVRREYGKPVFSFEVGQYEVLPDFGELELFQGISDPVNLKLVEERVRQAGLWEVWPEYVEATGELSLLGYREEVEAAMRTRELSGISLLGLQDFPGQGTALVGMLNSHLQPKPYAFARPERFRAFFRDCLPLVLLEKYTYTAGEVLRADVLVANYGKGDLAGKLEYVLEEIRDRDSVAGEMLPDPGAGEAWAGRDGAEQTTGCLGQVTCQRGTHTLAGTLQIPLGPVEHPVRLDLKVWIGEAGSRTENTYPVWVYPKVAPCCPATVHEARLLDGQAKRVLEAGGILYLAPPSNQEYLPFSIQAQFTTDFWSVGTFRQQEGGMGQLIDRMHPLFARFPTESHTNWQWWPMAIQRAVILPRPMECIITEMDSYAFLRPMAQLVEFRCGGGKVLLSSMGLQNLQQYPEARALLDAIYRYLESEDFAPVQELTVEELERMVRCEL